MPSHPHTPDIRVLRAAQQGPGQSPALEIPGPGDGAPAEAFPREAVRDLVGDTLSHLRRREVWQDASITVGLALIALALPTQRLLGDGVAPVQWTERGAWLSIDLLLQPLAQLLSPIPSIGPERAWFLLAAVCWAAAYPVLVHLGTALGFSRLASCFSAILVLISPMAALSATLPGPGGGALLGSAILFTTLATIPARRPDGSRSWLPLGAWLGVSLLAPNLALFLPAVVLHALAPGSGRKLSFGPVAREVGIALAALALLLFPLLLLSLRGAGPATGAQLWSLLAARWLGTSGTDAPVTLIWLMVLPAAIGVGAIGIRELFRNPQELRGSPRLGWVAAWVAVPLAVKVIGGTPSLDSAAWVLGPLAALGLASFLDRRAHDTLWRYILILIGVQMVLSVGFRTAVGIGDPRGPWIGRASRMLVPGDVVLTRDQHHDYLLRHRFHVRTINLRTPRELGESRRADWWARARETVRAQARAGGRVVVDWKVADPAGGARGYPFQQELHEIVLLGPVLHLDPTGEEQSDLEEEARKQAPSLDGH